MTKTKILVLKYNETDWDIISESGELVYSYLDDEYGYMKIQRYMDKIEKPVFTYDGLLEQLALGNAYIEDLETFSRMNAEIFEEIANDLAKRNSNTEFEITVHSIPEDTPSGWEAIAKALINEFLFGKTQKARCPKCAKKQVFALVQEDGWEEKLCTECKTKL